MRKRRPVRARRSVFAASSRLRSICAIDAMPARTPTGMLRNTLHATRMIAVPVISIGGTLNARMYETPITVPGMANDSIVPNSNAPWPAKRWRVSSHAARMPSAAVSGAAIADSLTVVQNEFHAAPAHRRPCGAPFDAERLHVVLQRRRVVAPPRLDEAAGERHRVDHDRQQRPWQRDCVRTRCGCDRAAAVGSPASPLPDSAV